MKFEPCRINVILRFYIWNKQVAGTYQRLSEASHGATHDGQAVDAFASKQVFLEPVGVSEVLQLVLAVAPRAHGRYPHHCYSHRCPEVLKHHTVPASHTEQNTVKPPRHNFPEATLEEF